MQDGDEKMIVIWGASGHAASVLSLLEQLGGWKIVAFVDDQNSDRVGATFCGQKIIGEMTDLEIVRASGVRHAFIAIGDNAARCRCADIVTSLGFICPILVHPTAFIAPDAVLGPGTVVMANATINTGVEIGGQVIINSGAIVEHGTILEDGVHIAPGAAIGGDVRIGRGSYLGIQSGVREKISIGSNTIIGACAAVVTDIPSNVVAYGVPARVQKVR